jgi:polysaccharide export outer membrane protein
MPFNPFMKRISAHLCIFFVSSGLLFAQNVPNQRRGSAENSASTGVKPLESASKAAPTSANSLPDLRLGAGDLLEIKVYAAPDLSDTARISGAGEITMPLIGAVKVAGMSVEMAQTTIEQRLLSGGFMRDPHVSILVREFATQGISVLGEVARPGIYPMLGSRRLFDAIAAAGGTTNRAGKTVTITHRDQPGVPSVLNLSQNPTEAADQNLELRPGDTVMVSKAGIVYVSGDVKMPGGYVMDNNENLTVLQAIALAQGLNPTASARNVRIIRRNSGKLEQIPIQLKQIMQAKSPDVALENEDVLFIPNSTSKSAARRSLESIVQVATGLAIYRR